MANTYDNQQNIQELPLSSRIDDVEAVADSALTTSTTNTSDITNLSVQVDTNTTEVNKKVDSDPSIVPNSTKINNMVALTQANYDAIATPDPATLYVII